MRHDNLINGQWAAGNSYSPNVNPSNLAGLKIGDAEIFGPVASVIRVKDYEEALATANDTPFGGRKGSSYGPREKGRYAQEFFTTVKTAYTLA
jgi:aldehyde dehydrogenase (NAD+)